MANVYVSSSRGSDANPGTATSPLLTIGKAIGGTPVAAPGDTVFIEPGTYREVVTLGVSPSSGSPLSIIGDGTGANFAAAGGPGTTGLVDWRGWTNDTTPITTTACLLLNSKSFVTLQGVKMLGSHGGSAGCIDISGTWSDITLLDCIFLGSIAKPYIIWAAGTPGSAMNLTVKRCDFLTGQGYCIDVRAGLYSAEYNVNVLVQNCRFLGGTGGVRVANASGTGSFFATGVTVQNCSFFLTNTPFSVTAGAGVNLTNPCVISGCYINQAVVGLSAGNTTHIAEDYNIIYATTARTSVNIGAHSITNAAPAFNLGDDRISGGIPRPFGEPMTTSPLLAFGYPSAPADDLYGQTRPGTPSNGALERDVFPSGSINIFNSEC